MFLFEIEHNRIKCYDVERSGMEIHIDSTTFPYSHMTSKNIKNMFLSIHVEIEIEGKSKHNFPLKKEIFEDLCLQHARVWGPLRMKACLGRVWNWNPSERGSTLELSLWNIQMEFISLFHMFRLFCVI